MVRELETVIPPRYMLGWHRCWIWRRKILRISALVFTVMDQDVLLNILVVSYSETIRKHCIRHFISKGSQRENIWIMMSMLNFIHFNMRKTAVCKKSPRMKLGYFVWSN